MGNWYGARHKVGDKKYMQLKEINLNFWTTEDKVYHNDYEINHHFKGHMKVELTDSNTNNFHPFGHKAWLPYSTTATIDISRLPQELRNELKAVWLKVEKAMVEGVVK